MSISLGPSESFGLICLVSQLSVGEEAGFLPLSHRAGRAVQLTSMFSCPADPQRGDLLGLQQVYAALAGSRAKGGSCQPQQGL